MEIVYTITDWYDGAQAGVAGFNGQPHYYESMWIRDESKYTQDDSMLFYWLTPIDVETFQLAIEDWNIWSRWQAAFRLGITTRDTHPALPEDRMRHDEISKVLVEKLVVIPGHSVKARGAFRYGPENGVEWTLVS